MLGGLLPFLFFLVRHLGQHPELQFLRLQQQGLLSLLWQPCACLRPASEHQQYVGNQQQFIVWIQQHLQEEDLFYLSSSQASERSHQTRGFSMQTTPPTEE